MSSPRVAVSTNGAIDSPKHIFVFDSVRTRSHLFWRWIGTHPALHTTYRRYILAGFLGPERFDAHLRMTEEEKADMDRFVNEHHVENTYETSSQDLEKDLENAEQAGKLLFTDEHCVDIVHHYIQMDLLGRGDRALPRLDLRFPNPTYIPERLLSRFKPVILVRHPILQVDSVYRAALANTEGRTRPGNERFDSLTSGCFHLFRLMFEYFRLCREEIPIVVDAEDMLWRTDALGEKLCNAFGIDPHGLSSTWDRMPDDWFKEIPFVRAMTKTMIESTGIQRPEVKPGAPNKETARGQWTERYGDQIAQQLMDRVDVAMPHYEYLMQFKL